MKQQVSLPIPSLSGIVSFFGPIGRPGLVLAAIAFFLGYGVDAVIREDLFVQAEHLGGIVLLTLLVVFGFLLAVVFLFDAFLCFREFNVEIKKWEKRGQPVYDKEGVVVGSHPEPTMVDGIYVLGMAIRSGLVFLALAIVGNAAMSYVDAVKVMS